MTEAIRYDAVPIQKAQLTPEGYLVDTPILGRTGVQLYRRADGKLVREYRPPAAVFDPLFLNSMRGRPIVNGHPGRVTSQNVRTHQIGTLLSEGRQDGSNIRGDIIIHDTVPVLKGGKRELSLGYLVSVRDEAGVSPEGEHYDAIQDRIICCDHLAVVDRGRAGNAKLNLDGADAAEVTEADAEDAAVSDQTESGGSEASVAPPTTSTTETTKVAEQHAPPGAPSSAARLVLVRVDGIEYSAPPEVVRDLDRLRDTAKAEKLRADTAEAERDGLKEKVAKFDAEKAQVRLDAAAQARARVKLETEADKHGVEVRSDMSDRDVREAVIRKLRGSDGRFDGKSDDYVSASYDIAVTEASRSADQNARNRAVVQQPVPAAAARADGAPAFGQPQLVSAAAARERMIRNSLSAR